MVIGHMVERAGEDVTDNQSLHDTTHEGAGMPGNPQHSAAVVAIHAGTDVVGGLHS